MTKQARRIESRENKLFKTWVKALQPHGVDKTGLFVLSGEKLVGEALAQAVIDFSALIKTEKQELPGPTPTDFPVFELSTSLFHHLDELGTNSPLLIGKVPEIPDWTASSEPQGLEVFLPLQDPGNLGGAIRTAVAFGAKKIVILSESAHPFLGKSLKASAGAILEAKLEWGPSINELRPEQNFYALDGGGRDVRQIDWPKDLRLLLGEEGRGVPETLKHPNRSISVPISNSVESLNAGVALGIVLHELKAQS